MDEVASRIYQHYRIDGVFDGAVRNAWRGGAIESLSIVDEGP